LKGSNIHYTGSENINNGWINSYGQQWWDANPSNATGITGRPHLMVFNVQKGSIKRLKSRKPIAWNVQVKGNDIDISDSIVDAVSDKWESFPFNTDAFDIGASNVRITNLIAYNGDDAVAVNDGAHNLYVSDSTIGYQTHGMCLILAAGCWQSRLTDLFCRPVYRFARKEPGQVRQCLEHPLRSHHRCWWLVRRTSEVLGRRSRSC
jgi:hypothetical protein